MTASGVGQRILDAFRQPVVLAAKTFKITASVGVAYGAAGTNADELLRNADLAMYAAKAEGKNRQRAFTPELHAAALERLDQGTDLPSSSRRVTLTR